MLPQSDDEVGAAACPRRAVISRRGQRLPPDAEDAPALWFITVTLGGERVPDSVARAALERLSLERPFIVSVRYDAERAEIRYWDECDAADEAVEQAMRMWSDHEMSAGLPAWRVVGLEVHDRDTARQRWERNDGDRPYVAVLGEIRPFDVE